MRLLFTTAAAMAALSLAACQPAGDATTEGEAPAASEPTADAPTVDPDAGMVLSADGLVMGDLTLELGAGKSDALAMVSQALGGQPTSSGAYEECGAGATDYANWEGFTLLFTGDELSGWESTSPDLATPEGVHAGSTADELRAAYPDLQVQETSVGWVFSTGDLYGFLSEDQSTVERIRLGANCDAH